MGARIRQIHPELWADDRVQRLPWEAVPAYIGMVSIADDDGRFKWDATQLAASLLGQRRDVTAEDMEIWMGQIADVGLVNVYRVGDRAFANHRNWRLYQHMNKMYPSRLPSPDGRESAHTPERRPAIYDDAKRKTAVAYGCTPGETLRLMCTRCEENGEIRWPRRQGGRPGSSVGLIGLKFVVTDATDVGADNDVRIACATCDSELPMPASVSDGPLFEDPARDCPPVGQQADAEILAVAADAQKVSGGCPSSPMVLVSESILVLDSISKSVGGVGEPKVDRPIAAAAASPPTGVENRQRIKPEESPPPVFSAELEAEVVAFIAVIARHNGDGRISAGRIDGTRREIARRAANLGEPAILHGLREAIRYDKPAIEYANACARKYRPEDSRVVAGRHVAARGGGFVRTPENWTPRWEGERKIGHDRVPLYTTKRSIAEIVADLNRMSPGSAVIGASA